VEGSYDLLITQRLILQPQIEMNFYTKDDPVRGRPFASLPAIARQITGTPWNGPAFFGLREKRS
jgi:hypothetical protein